MDMFRIAGLLAGVAVAVVLTSCSRKEDELPAPPEWLIHDPRILERARAIVLVRVLELEMQTAPREYYATMLVLKSWKGPFSAGRVLHTPKGYSLLGCNSSGCDYYHFQFRDQGKEFLIMSFGGTISPDGTKPADVIGVFRKWAWPAERSQALIAALDQAVADSMPTDKAGYAARLQKEEAAIKDVETKLRTAESNHAPDDEVGHLSNQLRGHQENAWRFRIARDYLDKHPEKSEESVDRLVGEALPPTGNTATAEQQGTPH
jgi:hypothetical protein